MYINDLKEGPAIKLYLDVNRFQMVGISLKKPVLTIKVKKRIVDICEGLEPSFGRHGHTKHFHLGHCIIAGKMSELVYT